LSAQNEEEKTPEIVYEGLIHRLPSVPSESSGTQKTECTDHNDNLMDTDQPLTTQKTYVSRTSEQLIFSFSDLKKNIPFKITFKYIE